jgi:hypothetical protein
MTTSLSNKHKRRPIKSMRKRGGASATTTKHTPTKTTHPFQHDRKMLHDIWKDEHNPEAKKQFCTILAILANAKAHQSKDKTKDAVYWLKQLNPTATAHKDTLEGVCQGLWNDRSGRGERMFAKRTTSLFGIDVSPDELGSFIADIGILAINLKVWRMAQVHYGEIPGVMAVIGVGRALRSTDPAGYISKYLKKALSRKSTMLKLLETQ